MMKRLNFSVAISADTSTNIVSIEREYEWHGLGQDGHTLIYREVL